jgi:hypothetical protein
MVSMSSDSNASRIASSLNTLRPGEAHESAHGIDQSKSVALVPPVADSRNLLDRHDGVTSVLVATLQVLLRRRFVGLAHALHVEALNEVTIEAIGLLVAPNLELDHVSHVTHLSASFTR